MSTKSWNPSSHSENLSELHSQPPSKRLQKPLDNLATAGFLPTDALNIYKDKKHNQGVGFFNNLFKKKEIKGKIEKIDYAEKLYQVLLRKKQKNRWEELFLEKYPEISEGEAKYLEQQEEREKRRKGGRRKKAFGGVIFKEGTYASDSATSDYEIFIKIKEGKISKEILSDIHDWDNNLNIVKVTPKTKEAFIEVHRRNIHPNVGGWTQSVYLMKTKKKIVKLNT